jgi:hypothetical protein
MGTVVTFTPTFFTQGTVDSIWLTVMSDDFLSVLLNGMLHQFLNLPRFSCWAPAYAG